MNRWLGLRLAIAMALVAQCHAQAGTAPLITGVTSAASCDSTQLAYSGYASVFGSGLADATYTSPDSNYGTKLGSTEVLVCSSLLFQLSPAAFGPQFSTYCQSALVVFATPTQVKIVLPAYSKLFGNGTLIVARVNGVIDSATSAENSFRAKIQTSAPSKFLAGADCTFYASSQVPAAPICGIQSGLAGSGQVERGIIT